MFIDFLGDIINALIKHPPKKKMPPLVKTRRPKIYKMVLERRFLGSKSTIGKLFLDGIYICNTLEDTIRETKIYGKTAIPYGTYEVVITYSPKYKRQLPRLQNVPGYTGILIHPGNSPKDTHGCILPGTYKESRLNWVGGSRKAFNKVFKKLKLVKKQGKKIRLEII